MNFIKNLMWIFLAITVLWSCGEEEEGYLVDYNRRPIMVPQHFNPSENISDGDLIGIVRAFDADGDTLNFSLTANDNDLFQLTSDGELRLAGGKNLDFDVADVHIISVTVTDGMKETTAKITINVQDQNNAMPVFSKESYQFETPEGISTAVIIGIVDATDNDASDELVYAITENDNGLFEINNAGEISLAPDQNLDFEMATEHNIMVSVSDGTYTVEAEVEINVLNEVDTLAEEPASFVTNWQIPSDNFELAIGANENYDYDFTIDWGDGTVENITVANPESFTHTYELAGLYSVAIQGDFPAIRMFGVSDASRLALVDVEQWGDIVWQTFQQAFAFCLFLEGFSATDAPNLTNVASMNRMFSNAIAFNADIGGWNVTNVLDMSQMFFNASSFNGDIGDWNVGNVQAMNGMFYQAEAFDQDIGGWITNAVTDMANMFQGAVSFDQDIGNWNVINVTDMGSMFRSASQFNQDISGWETNNGINMSRMFQEASAFNQGIGEGDWDTGKVTNMSMMFQDAASFDQDLGSWNIADITTMVDMFDNSGMSPASANATLIGWADFVDQNGGPTNINCGMQGITVCGPEVDAAGMFLAIDNGWLFPGINNQFNCPP